MIFFIILTNKVNYAYKDKMVKECVYKNSSYKINSYCFLY